MLPTSSKPWLEPWGHLVPVGAALCCEEADTPGTPLSGIPAASQHKAAPTGTAQAFRALNDKAAVWQNPEGVGCQVAALRSAAQKRPGRPGIHSSRWQCSRLGLRRKSKVAALFNRPWSIADMNGRRSLSSCFVPRGYKVTGKSRFRRAREHLTTPIFSENVCTPKSNGRMN